MSIKSFFCKIGIHNGEPFEAIAPSDDTVENNNTTEKKQNLKCVRCGKVYLENLGYPYIDTFS
jgi:transposase-like protein